MKYTHVVENNKVDLNNLYVYDLWTPELIMEFARNNGLVMDGGIAAIKEKMFIIDNILQQIKSEKSDEDMKKCLKKVFSLQ